MKPGSSRKPLLVVALVGALACGTGAWYVSRLKERVAALEKQVPPAADRLPTLFPAPAFSLTSEQGKTVTSADYRGSVWVADFVFVSCAGICPAMTSAMGQLAKRFEARADVRFVSFDVDPDRDSIDVLKRHAESLGADPLRWSFLRGDSKTIRALSKDGFKLGIEDGKPGDPEPVLHSNRFTLVDRAGVIRGYYEGTDPEAMKRLERDLPRLLAELAP